MLGLTELLQQVVVSLVSLQVVCLVSLPVVRLTLSGDPSLLLPRVLQVVVALLPDLLRVLLEEVVILIDRLRVLEVVVVTLPEILLALEEVVTLLPYPLTPLQVVRLLLLVVPLARLVALEILVTHTDLILDAALVVVAAVLVAVVLVAVEAYLAYLDTVESHTFTRVWLTLVLMQLNVVNS